MLSVYQRNFLPWIYLYYCPSAKGIGNTVAGKFDSKGARTGRRE